jgi:LacI family transcriptional regulator
MSRVTVQQIADRLGVSKFAVSRALNQKPGVSESTREQVLKLANEMGYEEKPNRQLKKSIEVIYHDPDVAARQVWTAIQAGTQSEASRLGFETAVRWTGDPDVIKRLRGNSLGFILIGPHDMELIDAARDTGLPCVRIGEMPLLDEMDVVSSTDIDGARAVAEYLLQLGHRKIVYVEGKAGYPGRIDRYEAFNQVVRNAVGTAVRNVRFETDHASSEFSRAFLEMVQEGFETTAFFCGNDGVAVTVMSELMRLGLNVPDDVSVVGHADFPIATQITPQLTTVRSHHRDLGIAAVRLLLSRCGAYGPRNDLPPQRVMLIDTLVVRGSTAGPPAASWRWRLDETLSARALNVG